MDYEIGRQPMICASAVAEEKRYHLYHGNGRRWLVADVPNAGDYVYVEGERGSQGFAGRELTFKLVDGNELKLKGPWHSNSQALFAATGVDVRDKHLTSGVVGTDRGEGFLSVKNVIWQTDGLELGPYDRVEKKAQELANLHGRQMWYCMQSAGGGSCGPVNPEKESS